MGWFYLGMAIVAEVIATTALKYSDGFTRWLPSGLVVVGYGAAFYLLALTLRTIPIGLAYAVWAGVGVVLVTLVGVVLFKQRLPMPVIAGLLCIIVGVVLVQMYSSND